MFKKIGFLFFSLLIACASSDKKESHIIYENLACKKSGDNIIVINEKVKPGETLSSILKSHNIDNGLAQQIILEFKQIYDVRYLKPNDIYSIEIDTTWQFLKLIYQASIELQYVVSRNDSGMITAEIKRIELEKKIKQIKGSIQTTLYDAIINSGETPELLISLTDIFQWDVDFFIDPREGDEFKIVYETFLLPDDSLSPIKEKDRFVRYGKILVAQYKLQGKELTAIYFDNTPNSDGYYTLSGESFQKTFLKSPLNYRRISSYFSYSRRHPILKTFRPHYGVDFAAPIGTPVSASADGIIIDKGYDRGIGNFIKIKHKNPRFVTLYGHLSRFARGMDKGVSVKQRDIIGYVGKTGLATGPHLHYTFYLNGKPINPLKIKNTSGDPITKENKEKFELVKAEMLSQLAELDKIEIPFIRNLALMVHYNRYLISEP